MYNFPLVVPFEVPEKLGRSLSSLDLETRTINLLLNAGFQYIVEPLLMTVGQQLKIKNLGRKNLGEFAMLVGDPIPLALINLIPTLPSGSNSTIRLFDLPGGDVLLRRVQTLALPAETLSAIDRAISDPTLVALVLTPNLPLDAEQKALVNEQLAPFGLRLDMTIHDLWVQESSALNERQMSLLSARFASVNPSATLKEWACSTGTNPTTLTVWAHIRLLRQDHPFRAEIDALLRTVGLNVHSHLLADDAMP